MNAAAPRYFGFGLQALKKYPELIPLVTILSGAVVMCGTFCGYALYQKPDVRINKNSELPPFERVNPSVPQKLITINQKYAAIPELEQLRAEIGSYKV